MYKKIMLSLLLLPCMVVSNSDKDCQIEQLKQAQRDKEKEIALIVKTIDEKESLIDSIVVKINMIEKIFKKKWIFLNIIYSKFLCMKNL